MSRFMIGIMSGTSLDGIDVAIAAWDDAESALPRLAHHHFKPFDAPLRNALLALQAPGADEIHRAALAGNQLAQAYAAAVHEALDSAKLSASHIDAIGCHGQTVRHRPQAGYTTQLGNAALLAELTGIRVVSDFRSRDIAAGGQGAPLVPAFHRALFHSANEHRVIVNIGGIANITDLPPLGPVTGFDCGPGNALMDGWIHAHQGVDFDRDGAWAATGHVCASVYNLLILDNFFSKVPPKSTGRDDFHADWVRAALRGDEAPKDVQATLLEVTAQGIAQAVTRYCAGAQAAYVCGGGAHNAALMARIAQLLAPRTVADTHALGLDPDWVEALAFAWLAHRALCGLPGNLPEVTGARGPRVLGAIYPA